MQRFTAKDKSNRNILIEMIKAPTLSSSFTQTFHSCHDILIEAYTPIELNFAKKFPKAISTDKFLSPLHSIIRQDAPFLTDWNKVERQSMQMLKAFFSNFTSTMEGLQGLSQKHHHLLVLAKEEQSQQILGSGYFLISQDPNSNKVKIPIFGVKPDAQELGIGKLLISSLFKLNRDISCIQLKTRRINENALKAYRRWGFTQSLNYSEHWVDLEYRVPRGYTLQETAELMKPQF